MEDYSRFARMLLGGGVYEGVRILGEKTVEFMRQDRLSPRQKGALNWDSNLGCGYGCLMRVLTDQGEAGTIASPGEYGWDGWTGNYMTIDPADDMVAGLKGHIRAVVLPQITVLIDFQPVFFLIPYIVLGKTLPLFLRHKEPRIRHTQRRAV